MRKEIEIQITDRDKNLIFFIKEMPAAKLEKWLIRLFLALCTKENKKEDEILQALYAGNFLELFASMNFENIEDLLDELLTCVQRRVDNGFMQLSPQTIDNHIEDVRTLFKLRMEVLKLNLNFLLKEGIEEETTQNIKKNKAFPTFNMKAQTHI